METLPTPGSFADKVQMLDAALTGKGSQDVAQTWRNKPRHHEPANWFEAGEYYLSDGGYSRVFWSIWSECLCLTSNSTDAVKARWANCKELIADVEAEIIKALGGHNEE